MSDLKSAAKLALEALKKMVLLAEHEGWEGFDEQYKAIKAIEEALSKQEQGEPVAWIGDDENLYHDYEKPHEEYGPEPTPLYTTQPQRTWVGLTNDECVEIAARGYPRWLEFAQAVEAKLKEKNNG